MKRAAEIPVCQFKWHSPSSNACIFKSTAKCGKQGAHSYPLWKEHVSGAGKQGNTLKRLKRKQCRVDFSSYYPVLICWLFHLLPTGLPVHLQPGRLQSVCCRRIVSLEEEVPVGLLHLPTVEVCVFFSCHAVTACMPWPRPVFYSGISTGSHQICDWHSQQKSALRDIHLLFHQQTVWKQLLKKVNASGGVHGGAYENQKGRNSSSVSRWVVAWMHYNIYGPKCRD